MSSKDKANGNRGNMEYHILRLTKVGKTLFQGLA